MCNDYDKAIKVPTFKKLINQKCAKDFKDVRSWKMHFQPLDPQAKIDLVEKYLLTDTCSQIYVNTLKPP